MLLFKKVNSKVSSINNYLQKYLESNQFEKNLKEALNNKNYGVSNSLLYDLSISTYDATYYKRVISEVFKAIQEKPSKWRRIYKGLRLCEYVMKNGCEYFISDVKEKEELIKKLAHFTYLENLRDKGIGIREISNNILALLRDNTYLRNERIEAAKYANLCTNIESKVVEKKRFFLNKKKKGKNQDENNKKGYFKSGNNNKYGPQKESLDQIKYEKYDFKRYVNDDDYYTNHHTEPSQYRTRNYNKSSINYSSKSSVDNNTENSIYSSNESSNSNSTSSSSESSSDNSSDNEPSNCKSRRNISKKKGKKTNNFYSKRSKDIKSSSRSKSQSLSSRSHSKQSYNNSSSEDSSTSSDSTSKSGSSSSSSSSSSNDSSKNFSDLDDSSYSRRKPRQIDKGDKSRSWKREVSNRIR
ncbi:epsin, putative [Plasmodium berghei]|uniref:Epsin, putative n=1 Tax=Plasmodium berghei TaxID=5821 RepID=A0A1D3SHZ5_PLABE|nr:epsin, putative [Plasmodium berghei]